MRSVAEQQTTVLVLDDDPIARAVFRKILRSRHFNVVEASTAEEAMRALRRAPWDYDLLIADCILDDSSGFEVALRARRLRPDLPVLLTSGTPQENVSDLGDGVEFLSKPFRPKTLESLVQRLLQAEERSATRQPEAAAW